MRWPWDSQAEPIGEPIRAELFSVERLEEHARSLAKAQEPTQASVRFSTVSRRLTENGAVLLAAYRELSQAIREESMLTPAAEWLVDNFHLVEAQLAAVRKTLPASYYRELPKVSKGHLAGYPRIYEIAWAYVAHHDSRFEPETLERFVAAYQEEGPLTIGELWAMPIAIRLVLIENLRRLADIIIQARGQRRTADEIADALLAVGDRKPEDGLRRLGRMEKLSRAMAVQLLQRLRDRDPATTAGLGWLLEHLAGQGVSADDLVNESQQRQAATNVTVRNIVTSLRQISSFEWAEFVESVGLVDATLSAATAFQEMSFATRDLYRHAVEELAKGSNFSQLEIAGVASDLARSRARRGREEDPGFFLIDRGRPELEAAIAFRPTVSQTLNRVVKRWSALAYWGSIVATSLVLLVIPFVRTLWAGGFWLALVMGLIGFFPAADLAVTLINRLVSGFVRPGVLPVLELEDGPTRESKTLIAIPVILTQPSQVDDLVERLEVHFLANPEGQFRFALLSDYRDADEADLPSDNELLELANAGINRLNERYPLEGEERFYLFQRRRLFNPSEGQHMGWERKRGKLHELNRLLRGEANTTFLSNPRAPSGIRYVITLDADSRLPPAAATRLVATIAHPLNQPVFSVESRKVTDGYGVLQPRVTPFLNADSSSFFQQAFSPPAGVDPYAAAVSDVYQDLFSEGSYAGKGIYDIDAFESALAGRVPDNALLSHDLFEGSFARAGLITNVEVFEEFPSHYEVAIQRQHRWVRGDWQLLPWIVGRRGALNAVARLKMVDNLRRSLSTPTALALLLAVFVIPDIPIWSWTALVLAALVVPALLPLLERLVPRQTTTPGAIRFRRWVGDTGRVLGRVGLEVSFLSYQAVVMVDAIVTALYRMLVSKRRLLLWMTSEEAGSRFGLDPREFAKRMSPPAAMGIAAAGVAAIAKPEAFWVSSAFAIVWLAAPYLAYEASKIRPSAPAAPLEVEEVEAFRVLARRTWSYFERFVTADDNFLPPDNFQEAPEMIAHRTSPTNIGLYLLSVLAAREFGWIGTTEAISRLEQTIGVMYRLERHAGHFLNWYDTRTLEPLNPRYISSVDSGNLAGHLLAVAQGCLRISDLPPGDELVAGVRDVALLIRQSADQMVNRLETDVVSPRDLDQALVDLLAASASVEGRVAAVVSAADNVVDIVRALGGGLEGGELVDWVTALERLVDSHELDEDATKEQIQKRLATLASSAVELSTAMDFGFLLDQRNKLLSVGYRLGEGALDQSHYDLLASEARLASFVGIAKGDLPPSHWFLLNRSMTPVGSDAALISWSGSMFEYLMPLLVMESPSESVLDMTYRAVVRRQIEYGKERDVPWGISEAAFAARDLQLTYQYSAFGVPGLGFERGLSEDLVVAPYASMLAAMVDPHRSLQNLERLAGLGALGRFGYYESLDFTLSRVPEDESMVTVAAYMGHHQAMSLVALTNVVFGGIIRQLFHNDPTIRAAELLLHERVPRDVEVARPRAEEVALAAHPTEEAAGATRRLGLPTSPLPETHLLSNGRYSVMITDSGSGYSKIGGLAVTRWREDPTLDNYGTFLFIRDDLSESIWSAGYQPTRVDPDSYQVEFTEGKAEITRRDGTLRSTLVVVVSAEEEVEVRRLTLANLDDVPREVEVTSYAELVLAPQRSDDSHPAFSNLFVQTEAVGGHDALLAHRRPRAASDDTYWAGHVVATKGEVVGGLQFETDRARFLGRGRRVHEAAALDRPLSNSVGRVLDPVLSLRRRVKVPPGETVHLTFSTVVATSREEALDLVDKFSDPGAFEQSLTGSWTQAQVRLHHLGVTPEQAHLFQQLAARLIYVDGTMRVPSATLAEATGGQPALWRHGMSGDLPIVLLRIDQPEDRGIVRDLLRGQEYWRAKGLGADLVIINEKPGSYVADLQSTIEEVVRTAGRGIGPEPDGGVFLFRGDLLSPEDRAVLQAAARAIVLSHHGTLADQLARRPRPPAMTPSRRRPPKAAVPGGPQPRLDLEFRNGLGGFAEGASEYVVVLGESQWTPAPWINVIANERLGFVVSESGAGFTWAANSRENQLTPWSNDPISDPPGEVIYIRDDDTGEVWSTTALPIRNHASTYLVRHGPGFSEFDHTSNGIRSRLRMTVPLQDPLKISTLRLQNQSGRRRRLSVTAYAEWVLGPTRVGQRFHIVNERDPATGALFARNPWNADFASQVAFADLGGDISAWTTDRTEFLGRHGTLERPAALEKRRGLSARTGTGFDPCAVLQRQVVLATGEEIALVLLLGQGRNTDESRALIERYRARPSAEIDREVKTHWTDILGALQVRTPDRSFDIMINQWLLYQALACRVLGRSAFYQAGGAYGFRDQLQDVMALAVPMRETTRQHLLRAAGRQFEEGDVQHWWHEPSGKGVRTRISDDYLWLPYSVAQYIEVTGDIELLDEEVPYLTGPELKPDEDEAYFIPDVSPRKGTIFDHCRRALDRARHRLGPNGLPLIGSGDWNDGFNRVGIEGRGESIWLGWFLEANLRRFADLADRVNKSRVGVSWRRSAKNLLTRLEAVAWDGDWYQRAIFDDGTPLGSSANPECRIDSIAQSWSVIHGGGQADRAERAMSAVEEYLVRRGDGLVLLFTPPFDRWDVDPGYIKGYLPGVRENGGQYTHAAIWSIIAFATLGQGDRAGELFGILNPINHASTRAGIHRYRVEPYVAAADIYSEAPHVGRGGWTWYTGAAGWMYRAGVEWILGFRLRGTKLRIDPCIPRAWRGFEINFRYHSSQYQVRVENPDGATRGIASLLLDDVEVPPDADLDLSDDGQTHQVRVILGG
ncbi:MAG: GH36-type glycosyl hydrolase domain-containing protein [Acidimicrobiia bacterium]